jgi:hypothetical protein
MAAVDERAAPWVAPADGEAINRLLSLVHEHLNMDVAYLAQFVEGQQIIRSLQGDGTSLQLAVNVAGQADDTYCIRVLAGQMPPAIPNARVNAVTRELPITHDLHIGSYVGTPCIGSDGSVEGMLCCMSAGPSPWLDEKSVGFLRLISQLISDHLRPALPVSSTTLASDTEYIQDVIDRSALRIAFQPVVHLADDEIVAYEALTRFDDGRFPSPAHTFALAARCGLGVELELVAVERALEHLPEIRPDRGLAINVSAATLLSPRLRELLLAHSDRKIGIELTEHSPVLDYVALDKALAPLRAVGIGVIVDDAGAGEPAPHPFAASGHHQARHRRDPGDQHRSGTGRDDALPVGVRRRDRGGTCRGGHRDLRRARGPAGPGRPPRPGLLHGQA